MIVDRCIGRVQTFCIFLKRAGVESFKNYRERALRRFLKGSHHRLLKLVAFELLILYIVFTI
jgi:hypothetical protein